MQLSIISHLVSTDNTLRCSFSTLAYKNNKHTIMMNESFFVFVQAKPPHSNSNLLRYQSIYLEILFTCVGTSSKIRSLQAIFIMGFFKELNRSIKIKNEYSKVRASFYTWSNNVSSGWNAHTEYK